MHSALAHGVVGQSDFRNSQNPWAVDKGSWVPGQMLFNKAAFEDPSTFNFYQGSGTRITNLRGFGYWNEDMGLSKVIDLSERFHVQFRAEAFNIWNTHSFVSNFSTSVSSVNFGLWNGNVSPPRNLQIGGKLLF